MPRGCAVRTHLPLGLGGGRDGAHPPTPGPNLTPKPHMPEHTGVPTSVPCWGRFGAVGNSLGGGGGGGPFPPPPPPPPTPWCDVYPPLPRCEVLAWAPGGLTGAAFCTSGSILDRAFTFLGTFARTSPKAKTNNKNLSHTGAGGGGGRLGCNRRRLACNRGRLAQSPGFPWGGARPRRDVP